MVSLGSQACVFSSSSSACAAAVPVCAVAAVPACAVAAVRVYTCAARRDVAVWQAGATCACACLSLSPLCVCPRMGTSVNEAKLCCCAAAAAHATRSGNVLAFC